MMIGRTVVRITGLDPRAALIMIPLALLIGGLSGVASAIFLKSLQFVTDLQTDHGWLLFFLPVAGALIAWLYAGYGHKAARGNNLIIEGAHDQTVAFIPFRMAPLILGTTLLTHLFGGSAGREGTAVQMGGSIAADISRRLKLEPSVTRMCLLCGIAGGFSGVFGAPLAAAVFAVEVLAILHLRLRGLPFCLIAALSGDLVIRLLDVQHGHYEVTSSLPGWSIALVAKIAVAGVAFGLASLVFSELTLLIERLSRSWCAGTVRRTALGGIAVVGVTLALGTRDYNGLSLPLLDASFRPGGVATFAFAAKVALTALTLGVGFKGGEVTPLFVIGATLGHTLGDPLGLPVDLLAALGFVAVFAAAANTPLACIVMGMELFSPDLFMFLAIPVLIAFAISGHRGIYESQRVGRPKPGNTRSHRGKTLSDIRQS